MAVTIIDVAHEAGVSKSTVSLVVNGNPVVKEETRLKVLAAIERLGYVANINARSLTAKRTAIIGVVLMVEENVSKTYEYDQETETFGYDVAIGVPRALAGTDYGMLMERFSHEDSRHDLPQLVKHNRVDGVIIIGGLFDERFIERLTSRGVPVVVVGRSNDGVDCVTADIASGAYLAVRNLIDTGHTAICCVNCPQKFSSHLPRRVGYEQAFASSPYRHDHRLVYCAHNNGLGGYEAVKELWEGGFRPDGIATANDGIALGVLRFLYEQHLRVPDDVSIVSYEDSVLSGYCSPPLSTVHFDKELMGEQAGRLLLKRIQHPTGTPEQQVVPVELLQRKSVVERQH